VSGENIASRTAQMQLRADYINEKLDDKAQDSNLKLFRLLSDLKEKTELGQLVNKSSEIEKS
jgi:hypothetical protein